MIIRLSSGRGGKPLGFESSEEKVSEGEGDFGNARAFPKAVDWRPLGRTDVLGLRVTIIVRKV